MQHAGSHFGHADLAGGFEELILSCLELGLGALAIGDVSEIGRASCRGGGAEAGGGGAGAGGGSDAEGGGGGARRELKGRVFFDGERDSRRRGGGASGAGCGGAGGGSARRTGVGASDPVSLCGAGGTAGASVGWSCIPDREMIYSTRPCAS